MTDDEAMTLLERIETLCNLVKLPKSARSYLEGICSDQLDRVGYLTEHQLDKIKEIEGEMGL